MINVNRSATLLLALFALAACGDAKNGADAGEIVVIDSAIPDAAGEVCADTMCGADCVDTTTSSAHCGGCDMACDSPGQICSGALPCVCPEAFLPPTLDVTAPFAQFQAAGGATVAIGALAASTGINVLFVVYNDTVALDQDYDLAADPMSLPAVGAAYQVDPQASPPTFHTPYQVTAGTLRLTAACATGAHGTLTNATFSESEGTGGAIIEGGCDFTVESIDFSIGDDCASGPLPDAGVPDPVADAG